MIFKTLGFSSLLCGSIEEVSVVAISERPGMGLVMPCNEFRKILRARWGIGVEREPIGGYKS
jgi:hypothetical protein